MKTTVEIKLTIQVPPEKVNEITDALLHVVRMKDVWNGKLEQGRVEIDFTPITNEDNLK
jgi:hypothetical protein